MPHDRKCSWKPPSVFPQAAVPAEDSVERCADRGRNPGSAAAEEKPMPENLAIRLPDLEVAMLVEVQKIIKAYRDLQVFLISQILKEHRKTLKGKASR